MFVAVVAAVVVVALSFTVKIQITNKLLTEYLHNTNSEHLYTFISH